MHIQARHFLDFVASQLPEYYKNTKVLDVGGGDINGNNRHYFKECEYHANDVVSGPNVTIISKTSALDFPDNTFDSIISSECFEHDMEYEASFKNIVRMLRPGGLFVFTCASTGRPEHGTLRTSPGCSLTTRGDDEPWKNYYKNLTAEDVCAAIPCSALFGRFAFYVNESSHDLYFFGIKGGLIDLQRTLPEYSARHVCLSQSL
jgi:SAM-dependent methyltransferase